MNRSPGGSSEVPDHSAQVMEDRGLSGFDDGMNGIEPKTVETIALKPVERITDREGPHLWNVIIDGVAPWRMSRGEECRRVMVEIVTFRTEVIVDDVEKHHEPVRMRSVDQRSQIIRPPIGAVRRIKQDAVVDPISPASEVGNGHQFDRGHSGLDQVVEPFDGGAKRTAGGEGADMNLQKRRILPGPPRPSMCPPLESIVVDDFAWPEHVMRLEMRGRIWNLHFAIDAILVERPGARAWYRDFVPAFRLRLHGIRAIQHHVDALGGRSPEAEGDATLMQFGAKARAGHYGDPENTRIDRGRACSFEPDANCAPSRGSGAVSRSAVQRRYCGRVGSVNSIVSNAALSTTKSGASACSTGPRTYDRKRPCGKFQSRSTISVACGVSHNTPNEPLGRRPSTQRRARNWGNRRRNSPSSLTKAVMSSSLRPSADQSTHPIGLSWQ